METLQISSESRGELKSVEEKHLKSLTGLIYPQKLFPFNL